MAARWGAAEETLIASHMDLLPLEPLGEAAGLSSRESLQSCIDPSILSIFEDMPTLETRRLNEESEATLLTALTEILDNVDDENLSPFDTLPDSDLLSKGMENSPLRRMLCQSLSPQKDSQCNTRPLSGGKSLSRMQAVCVQRSDGEEEEDGSFTRSPERPDLSGWEGLPMPLPVMLEHEGEEGLSVSLGDFVRHMHPYCMAISVENEEGEQMLPEGGIVLEVVDQGENGEPILSIPNMELSYPFYQLPPENGDKEDVAEDEPADTSEHIVVDDEDDAPVRKAFPPAVTAVVHLDANDEVVRRKKERKTTSPSRRKKKRNEKQQFELVEGRVLRSGTVSRVATDSPKGPRKGSVKEKVQKSQKVPSTSASPQLLLKHEGIKQCKVEKENTTVAQVPEKEEKPVTPLVPKRSTTPTPEESRPTCSATAVSSQLPNETPKRSASDLEGKTENSSAPSVSLPLISSESPAAAAVPEINPPISITPAVPEAKPKSLSLEEYRRLRQQKKPAPVEKQEKSVTKWPSLPELPKELPPLPHLPDPNPRDPRRANPLTAKQEAEVKPAWRPRGLCAPPTPEALLQPPAYMISSSSKASAATPVSKPQQTQDPSKLPQKPPTAPADSANTSAAHPDTPVKPTEPCVPQSFAPHASLKPLVQLVSSADGECSTSDSGRKGEAEPTDPKPVQDTKVCPETTTDVHKPAAAPGSVPSVTTVFQKVSGVTGSTSLGDPLNSNRKSSKHTAKEQRIRVPCAAFSLDSHNRTKHPAVVESKLGSTTAMKPQRAKTNTQELIESFTCEMGIEAADLTSLLEQFEETQAKEEKCVPEVSGSAAAVGNSRAASVPEKAVMERERANDLYHAAALAPKAAPPNQMWKPLGPATLLGKTSTSEVSKPSPSKVIQIEAQPLPLVRLRSKATLAPAPVAPDLTCMDHDYCLSKVVSPGEPGKRWNVKQQSVFTIKSLKQQPSSPLPTPPPAASPQSATNSVVSSKTRDCSQTVQTEKNREDESEACSTMETPDASPSQQECVTIPRRGPSRRSYRRNVASRTPSPTCSPKERTCVRSRKRFYRSPSPTSSCSDAYSSRSRSRSKSPAKKRYQHRNSDSSPSSSSRSSSRSSPSLSRSPPRRRRYSYSSSRSGSWSRSRSRSRSPQRRAQWSRSRGLHSPSYEARYCHGTKTPNVEETKRRKMKAIEERRVVYVGRIRGSMTQRELGDRFSLFGEIEECTLHFREHGDNYGFVTYYNTKDAFTAIENGSKLRKPDELPFDLCFGGRRQFCQSSYADLDSSREYEPLPIKGKYHALDFDTLLKQAQQNLKR